MTTAKLQREFDKLLTMSDLCEAFNRTPMTIHLWRKNLGLPTIRIKGAARASIRFHDRDVKTWAKRQGFRYGEAA